MSNNNYKIEFTSVAIEDLEEILLYISDSLHAENAATKLLNKIQENINRLKQYPYSCSYVLDAHLKTKGYRKVIVDNYIIFYKVNENAKQVIIMRIIYNARNYQDFL